jgi:hypothetical protein
MDIPRKSLLILYKLFSNLQCGYFFTQHRETLLVENAKIFREGLFCNPCLRAWIGCLTDG